MSVASRNVPSSKINTTLDSHRVFTNPSGAVSSQNILIFQNTGSTVARVDYSESIKSRFENIGNLESPVSSAIAIGADIYVDDAILPQTSDQRPRAIVAIKNAEGVGGNIYIRGSVTQIRSSLIAE